MKTKIPFKKHFDFEYEKIQRLSPLVRRIVAENPNFFTFFGTNTYIIGNGEVALIDPGPDSSEHIDTIIQGLEGEKITHILITHTHYDHWPAYAALQKRFNAQTYGYYPRSDARSQDARQSSEQRSLSTQERFEMVEFIPDVGIEHGDVIAGNDWTIESVFTPGHASNHLCFQLKEEQALFSGDHIMGWSTSVISPPSGNMEEYMDSLNLLLLRDDKYYWPAHGPGIDDPKPFVQAFIRHREEREQQILDQLKKGIHTIPEMVSNIYHDVPIHLHPAAERSTLATIVYLIREGMVIGKDDTKPHTEYYLTAKA